MAPSELLAGLSGPASIPWTPHGGLHKPMYETGVGFFPFRLQIPFSFRPFLLLSPLLLVPTNLKRKGAGLARPSCERQSKRHLQPDS